jgi:hypothetical protein
MVHSLWGFCDPTELAANVCGVPDGVSRISDTAWRIAKAKDDDQAASADCGQAAKKAAVMAKPKPAAPPAAPAPLREQVRAALLRRGA